MSSVLKRRDSILLTFPTMVESIRAGRVVFRARKSAQSPCAILYVKYLLYLV